MQNIGRMNKKDNIKFIHNFISILMILHKKKNK